MATGFVGYCLPWGRCSRGKIRNLSQPGLAGAGGLIPARGLGMGESKGENKFNISSRNITSKSSIPSKEFMAMFVGFVDGDGYIKTGPQRQKNSKTTIDISLVISLHMRDKILLEYMVKELKVGKIYDAKLNTKKSIYFSI